MMNDDEAKAIGRAFARGEFDRSETVQATQRKYGLMGAGALLSGAAFWFLRRKR